MSTNSIAVMGGTLVRDFASLAGTQARRAGSVVRRATLALPRPTSQAAVRAAPAFACAAPWSMLSPRHRLKRVIDLLLGVPVLAAALPIMLLAALAIKLVDGGPVLIYQERVGWQGRKFKVWKLRSMYIDSAARLQRLLESDAQARSEWMTYYKLRRDPRVLPVIGSFLRKSSIDELPQLWNVVTGQMSLVGPRPLPEYHLNPLREAFVALRHTVPPGLTGLWQVRARSEGTLHDLRLLDSAYVRRWSLKMDLWLIIQTPVAVLSRRGAC